MGASRSRKQDGCGAARMDTGMAPHERSQLWQVRACAMLRAIIDAHAACSKHRSCYYANCV